jgi:hypothetical protein
MVRASARDYLGRWSWVILQLLPSPRYAAAREAAPDIAAHFQRSRNAAHTHPDVDLSTLTDDIESLIDAAFWASLRREEGYVPRISLALVSPERAGHPLHFARPLALNTVSLVRVSPAVERPGIHLGVWRDGGALRVWGTTRAVPADSMVLEVSAPGLLVVKHQRGEGGKYVNVAVLEGDRIKVISDSPTDAPDCPGLVASLLKAEASGGWDPQVSMLVELAVSMRAHGRGGAMLIVPTGNTTWRESIVHPIPYAVDPSYTGLAELAQRADAEHTLREWQDQMIDTVRSVAGLTAVDGAGVLNDRYDLLGFGAKIVRRDGSPVVERMSVMEPIEGGEVAVVHPSRLGNTRHLSAAQFVHDQRDAMALVASQDGRFTIFSWSTCDDMVHAHRVEALLL